MKTQVRAAVYGVAALALAGVVIFSGTTLGLFPLISSDFNPGASAVLSVLLTDPPSVPSGVTAVYLTYSALDVHINGLGDAGWVSTGAQGTVETLGLVNLTQTISSGSIPSGTYNMIRLTITGVQVTFQGKNYSAAVNSGIVDVSIVGGLKVNTSNPSAAIVDIQPTVLNVGSQSAPEFVITAGAKALQVPQSDIRPEMRNVGFRSSIPEREWYRSFEARHSDNLSTESATLSAGSFTLKFTNPTSDPVQISMVAIAPSSAESGPFVALGTLAGSIVFGVGSDRSLQPVNLVADGNGAGTLRLLLAGQGYRLDPNATVTFTFTGNLNSLVSGMTVTKGSDYSVVVIGKHLVAAVTVQAG